MQTPQHILVIRFSSMGDVAMTVPVLKNLLEPSQPTPQLKKLTQLGAVESICHHPRQLTKLLIAYQRGLWIIFDFIKIYVSL